MTASFTNSWKESSLATKSVSQFTSIMETLPLSETAPINPSAADLLDFLLAFRPLVFLSSSIARSMSPLEPCKAFLQSIKPKPVFSLNSLTRAADISTINILL